MLLPHCRCDVECFRSGHDGTRTKMHIVPHCVHLEKGNNRRESILGFMTDCFSRDTM